MFSRSADIAEGSKSIGFSYSSIYIEALIETEGGIVASEEKTVSIESMNRSFSNVSFVFEGLDIEPVYTITINCYALLGEQREQMEMRTMFSV